MDRPINVSRAAIIGVVAAAIMASHSFADELTPGARQQLAERIEKYRVANRIPSIAVAVVWAGTIVFEEGFGWARIDEKVRATSHTPYPIGSVSKALTVAALMRLVEQGVVDLDRPINDYLGAAKLRTIGGEPSSVTVRTVANHTAGLMKYVHFLYDHEGLKIPSLDDQIAQYGVTVRPSGEEWIYSNLGIGAVARVIEVQSGRNYADYMEEDIFGPLKLTRTSVGPNAALAGETALKYSGDLRDKGKLVRPYAALPVSTGHIYSSAHDLARYAIFNLKHELAGARAPLTEASIDEMHRPTFYTTPHVGKAVAWATLEDSGRLLVVEHDGGGDGMRAELQLYPEADMAVVILVNADTRAFRGIRRLVLDELRPGMYDRLDSLYAISFPDKSAATEEEDKATQETRWLEAVKELAGQWTATIGGPLGKNQMNLYIQESGEIFVGLDNKPPGVLVSSTTTPSEISGWYLGHQNSRFEWRKAPHYGRIDLTVGDGRIRGPVRFVAYEDGDFETRYNFGFWAEFEKREAPPTSSN